MLRTMVSAVVGRLFPKIDAGENGTGYCHEPALDVDSLPQPVKEKLMNAKKDAGQKPAERLVGDQSGAKSEEEGNRL
ncbi:MAG TPA: hypothetical protein VN521_02535 [Negativicutes bacterium]|nr:hypothetical protein [Negativicutes bacterium]